MPQLLWDASALAKGYAPEVGRDTVRALLTGPPSLTMITTYLSYAETRAVLRRQLNKNVFNFATFNTARTLLRTDVFANPNFQLMNLDGNTVLAGIGFIDQYNLNATDAAILQVYLGYAQAQPTGSATCVLVACDKRLLQAADAEGLKTLNPENFPVADVPTFLKRP